MLRCRRGTSPRLETRSNPSKVSPKQVLHPQMLNCQPPPQDPPIHLPFPSSPPGLASRTQTGPQPQRLRNRAVWAERSLRTWTGPAGAIWPVPVANPWKKLLSQPVFKSGKRMPAPSWWKGLCLFGSYRVHQLEGLGLFPFYLRRPLQSKQTRSHKGVLFVPK